MSIPLQMASDSFIQVDRISRYRSHPGLPWQKTLPVNAILKDFRSHCVSMSVLAC